jgi:hypothetical protein
LWEDTKFAARHFSDIEQLAVVGETKWQHGMAVFCKPFTAATSRYFDHTALGEARTWLEEGTGGIESPGSDTPDNPNKMDIL